MSLRKVPPYWRFRDRTPTAMQSIPILLKVIRGQHPRGVVEFSQFRVILYSFTFITSLLSTLFFIATTTHHANTVANNPGYRNISFDPDPHNYLAISVVPLLWSAVWSFIVLRSLLNAINDSSISLSATPTTSAPTDSEALTNSAAEGAKSGNPNPAKPPRHQSRRCCCCTCSPWLLPTTGPHPVLILCIEIFLWSGLVIIVTCFGILPSHIAAETIFLDFSHDCPAYLDSPPRNPRRMDFYCLDTYRQVVGLEVVALVVWGLCTTGHLVALVTACVLVDRWRGKTGRKRGWRGERRMQRGSGGVHAGDAQEGWIEMSRGVDTG